MPQLYEIARCNQIVHRMQIRPLSDHQKKMQPGLLDYPYYGSSTLPPCLNR
jgi:hypothetical protein